MAQPQLLQIKLSRFDAQPWGFRLQGGTDFAQPLLVQKVNAGSLSEQAGLQPGDAVVKINDVDVFNLRHKDAQDIVVRSGNNFVITVQRGGSTWRPHVTPTGNVPQPNSPYLQTVTKTSLAHKQQDSQHIGCGYNNAARPFSNGGDGGVKSIVNKQYNTPVGIYSDESIAETLSAQAEVLAGGVLGVNFKKNEKEYQGDRSEVLKFLREEETGQSTPAFGNSHYEHDAPQQLQQPQQQYNQHQQHYHQQQQQQQSSTTRHVSAPVNSPKPPSTGGLPTGQNICTECERLITGVFVRIKDKNLHVECFKCATCGTSLKNQGYYNFNNKLYCDIHAKQAAINNPPTGTEGYVPVPIKPNTKLSASTISSALNSHGYGGHSNGYSNGNSTPAPAPVASSQATATVATVAPSAATAATAAATPQAATATDSPAATASSSDNMSAYVADEPSSIYGQISAESVALAPPPPQPPTAGGGDQPFEYVTLTGNVIRSVQAPGKGACPSYKVNQGYARPFGAAAPKSPVSYPPQQQQQSPRPAPGGQNPYATLPRSNVGQQGGEAVEELQPEFEEEDCYEMDIEVALAASRQSQRGSSFTWPPPQDDSHLAPTAAPLYIPPPETQHVVVSNPVQQVPPLPPGGATARLDPQPVVGTSANGAPQWQSYSAPQLTTASARQLAEQESSSDSYTSTSTTTTTTSEEYQRMYAAQVQAYQMQEQSGSEFDYQVDYASTQDSVQDYPSGRRSAQECVDSLAVPLSTYKLVDMVREVTPSPVTTPTQTPAPAAPTTRRVVFNDEPEIKELPQLPAELETIPEASEAVEDREGLVIEQRCQILESERKFQPTPEIKIEIAPVRQIPPTKIPNPMPKEWINPMIRVLTTAPEVPFHLVECPFPRPCGDDFEAEAAAAEAAKTQEVPEPLPPQVSAAPPATVSVEPSPAPLRESPPRGSRLSQAMVTAPEFELKFAPPADQGIPLPEETEPYMPPPIDTKPYLREDYRPKSPFVSALTTAPDRPFEGHFDKDVPIHMIDLPTPKEHLSMCDALCTAPERGYTPLNPENAMHRVDEEQKQQELKKREFQVLDHEEELGIRPEPPQSVEYYETRRDQPRKSSAFAAMQAFQPSREPLSSNTVSNAGSVADTPRASIVSALKEETDLEYQKYLKAQQRNQKRLDYFHQKEEELSGLQGQQLTQLQRELSNQQQNLLSQQQLQQSKLLQLQQCVQSQELQQQVQHLTQKSQQQPPQANQQQQQQQQQRGTQQQQHSQVTQRTQQQQQQVPQQVTQQQQQEHSLLSQTTLAETQTLQANAQSQSSASYSSKATACSNSSSTVPPANTSTAFAPAPAPAPTSIPVRPSAIAVQSSYCSSQFDVHELIEETAEELEHSEVLFPPPSPLSHLTKQGKAVQSGLHKADSIPKYQRNWTVLPTQSPIRTPEPQELRENVPLAFVDAPKAPVTSDSSTVHRPIAQVAAPTTVVAPSREREKERRPQLSVPIIVEDRSGPVTMAFQPLDELVRPDQALTPTRPYTPSLTNKPAPIVPFYQTEEKLVFEECSATHARNYNELNASPFPDRTRSPAPGPPPNPLNAIRAPRMKEPETKSNILSVSGGPRLQTGSITTGQSYQGQLLAHSEQSSQSASQSYNQQPERITEQRVGNLNIQQREQSSQLQQQAQSQTQSQTRSQVGNTQIERRRKVTEEFERTQSAKTIEIRTGSQSVSQSKAQSQSISQAQTQAQSQSQNQSDTERRSSYGKTGFVASQAKRLSCMEEEISSLTSQSQAISARASALGEGCFPNLRSPTFDSKFPLKPAPAESIVPGYATVPAATKMLTAPPPGFLQQQQQQQQRSAFSGYQATTSSVQQSSFASSSKATTSSLSSSSASASASASVARSSQSLTQASAITTTTNNQATTAYRSSNGSITKPNLASRPSIASITAPGSASAPAPVPSAAPTKATAPFKAPIVPKSVIANAVNAAAPPAPAVFPPDLSDLNLNSNVDNSPGAGGKSAGAFGATSAPKRGRGILNKAAGPGVRIPLCNSCNVQIRGPFITALGRIWCPDHFICVNGNCRRPLQDIGFVEEKGDLYCEYCFEKYLAPTCSKCAGKIKGDCLNAIGKHFHPECFTCGQCGKIFGNRPFFLEDGNAYCEADWNELFTTKCFACGFPVEAGDRWVEALNHNYHSQCFNCTFCKQNLEGQSFYNKGGRPFCKNHAR
uniref:PDZ and LIM domain protein Zasp n=2 Tax=Drosophila melanogaster TaxID=7227 RepID=ZASP_DROME|nr:Z band alternatively spliced PDZ-motif protein 52, isoform F [Drosophila melanogaster]A1ZA47.2 RecName: Full=PDZ and LIM domain protein Zasp; AltName: Full=Z band alternatively spliced PDZ-motif protein [Drosophila melanogaster]AAZ52806.2 Z band alternatively spliced PDZ-motif protein 52, isoform F [Drosophila melanogaster]|eukprot:NP_001027420.2 Z band alternatively spliced PDZ-motif protein 52, isoform F [Drosophila melanogaster]